MSTTESLFSKLVAARVATMTDPELAIALAEAQATLAEAQADPAAFAAQAGIPAEKVQAILASPNPGEFIRQAQARLGAAA